MSWTRNCVAILAAGLAAAQEQPKPAFEVASVKVSGPQSRRDGGGGPGTRDPGAYHFTAATMRDLIAIGYHVEYFQIIGKDALESPTFDVVAKVPVGATREQFREMMQGLLKERFHLKMHRESREFPAWEMTVAKSGLKMKESAVNGEAPAMSGMPKVGDDGFPILQPNMPGMAAGYTFVDGYMVGRLIAQRQPISAIAQQKFGASDTPPIVDKTGLTGRYDFKLEFSREPPGGAASEVKVPPVPELFRAMEQQLGLHLAERKLPFDTIVVESFDRAPTEN